MTNTIAFDVYGTLIDVHGVVVLLEDLVGKETAMQFSKTWRTKQFEYLFRRALMDRYVDFEVCTRQALDFTCMALDKDLSGENRRELLAMYRKLPAFEDVSTGLADLKERQLKLYAFSNGLLEGIRAVLEYANLIQYFDDIISVDPVKSFKPDPKVYEHFLNATNSRVEQTWLVSSNPFDVIGARASGWRGVWVKRADTAVFDPWDVFPTTIVTNFSELSGVLV